MEESRAVLSQVAELNGSFGSKNDDRKMITRDRFVFRNSLVVKKKKTSSPKRIKKPR